LDADELTRKIEDAERRLEWFRKADSFSIKISIPWSANTKKRSASVTLGAREIRAPIVAALEENIAALRRHRDILVSLESDDDEEEDVDVEEIGIIDEIGEVR
jgi:hypothetical protein